MNRKSSFLIEGLFALLACKEEAFRVVSEEMPNVGFIEHDFGIPQINSLIEKLENDEDSE